MHEWADITFMVFDRPMYAQVFMDGRINNNTYKHSMKLDDNLFAFRIANEERTYDNFDDRYKMLKMMLRETGSMKLLDQELLPFHTPKAQEIITERLTYICDELGGEGLILKHPAAKWEPVRSKMMYKAKKWHDAEGIVIGMKAGKEGVEDRLLGKMGSLRLRWKDIEFDLSGFTDDERALTDAGMNYAFDHPGEEIKIDSWPSLIFKEGDSITFRYREVTDDGIPKEARFWRKDES